MKLLLTCPPMIKNIKRYEEKIKEYGFDLHIPTFTQIMSEEELIKILPDFDAWIIGDDPATRKVLEAGKKGNLKICAKWGVGTDNVDFEACKDLGIPITNTPGVFGEEVSDVAIGMMLNLSRDLCLINENIKNGNWYKPSGISLSGKKVCLIGFGDIGQCLARKLLAFNLDVFVSDPDFYKDEKDEIKSKSNKYIYDGLNKVNICNLIEASKNADFIMITCALNKFTKYLVNEDIIRNSKEGVYIINVGRGPILQEEALLKCKDHIGGIGLDVFEKEPIDLDNKLFTFEKYIFGSHNGSNTIEGVDKVSFKVIEYLRKYFQGQ